MLLDLALETPRLILQLSARTLEGVVQGEIDVSVAFVDIRRMRHIDLLALR